MVVEEQAEEIVLENFGEHWNITSYPTINKPPKHTTTQQTKFIESIKVTKPAKI